MEFFMPIVKPENASMKAIEILHLQRASARAAVRATAENVAQLERRAAKAESQEAERLVALIVAGGPSADRPAGVDPDLVADLVAARRDASINAKVLATLESAAAQAAAELQTAETAVVSAVDTMFFEEDVEEARQIAHFMNEVDRRGRALLHLSIANEMNGQRPPQEVCGVLARLDVPLLDRRTVAVSVLKYGDQAAAQLRETRRAALIAGDVFEEDASYKRVS
jgi:hypothetical protein